MKSMLLRVGPVALGVAAVAFAFPLFHWWPLAWVGLVPLFLRAGQASPRAAAGWFFFAGWLFHTLLLQWLLANVMWAGGWAVWGYQLLCVALALFWIPLGYAWRRAAPHLAPEAAAILLAALWGVMEWAHANVLTGFGWSALGYSQGPDLTFAQLAALGGVSLLSVLLVLVNALLALALASPQRRVLRIALTAAIVAAAHALGATLLHPAQPREDQYRVGIAQSNFPIEMKYDRDYTVEMVNRCVTLGTALQTEESINLMVWPEAMVMSDFHREEVLSPMRTYCTEMHTALYSGSIRDAGGAGYNSSVLIGSDGEIKDYYDKVHLVPFGEYIPFASLFPFLKHVVPSNATSGAQHKLLSAGGPPFGPMICFEVLYSGIAETLYGQGASFFTVITNLAWFGQSAAVPQELEIARFRAIETRTPLVHAANTGISGVFDPYGRLDYIHGFVRGDRYVNADPNRFPADATHGERMVGAFDLPAQAPRPWRHGTGYFTTLCAASALALLGFAAAKGRN